MNVFGFRRFFERMNPYAMILDETIHTVPHVLVRYPLVFATGKCLFSPRLLGGCLLARRAGSSSPIENQT
jgi:hypothetical protein